VVGVAFSRNSTRGFVSILTHILVSFLGSRTSRIPDSKNKVINITLTLPERYKIPYYGCFMTISAPDHVGSA
jgi:hypothetical protein